MVVNKDVLLECLNRKHNTTDDNKYVYIYNIDMNDRGIFFNACKYNSNISSIYYDAISLGYYTDYVIGQRKKKIEKILCR